MGYGSVVKRLDSTKIQYSYCISRLLSADKTRNRSGEREKAHQCNQMRTLCLIRTINDSSDLTPSANFNFLVRRTVIELSPLVRVKIRTPTKRLNSRRRSNLMMVPLERASMICYLKVSTRMTYLKDIEDFTLEPFY